MVLTGPPLAMPGPGARAHPAALARSSDSGSSSPPAALLPAGQSKSVPGPSRRDGPAINTRPPHTGEKLERRLGPARRNVCALRTRARAPLERTATPPRAGPAVGPAGPPSSTRTRRRSRRPFPPFAPAGGPRALLNGVVDTGRGD